MNDFKPPFDEVTRENEIRELEIREGEIPDVEIREGKPPEPPKTRRILRILAIVAAVLILLVASLPFVISLESVRGRLLAGAEAALHRKVEAGRIRLRLFPLGAGAEKVVVHNKPGWTTPALLSAETVSVRLAFWPLLARRAEVRRIGLDGVTLTVERDAKGALNVDDFLSASGRASAGARPATAAAILVSNVAIARGKLQLVDRKVVPGDTVTTTLDGIDGVVEGISATAPARVALGAGLFADAGRNVVLKGTVGPLKAGRPLGESALALSLSVKNVALAKLGAYLGERQEADPGVLSFDATATGSFLGSLRLAGNVALVPREGGGGPLPALEGQLVTVLDWPHGALTVEPSPLSVAKVPMTVQGRIDGIRTAPRLDLRFATPGEVAVDGVSGLPGPAGTLPPGVKLSGRVRLTAEVAGTSADRTRHASLAAAPLEVSRDGQPLLDAGNASVTLESRVGEPRRGRLSMPSGKLEGAAFQNLLADWTLEKGVLTLAPAGEETGGGAPRAPSASADLSDARGQALLDALTKLLREFLHAPAPAIAP